MRIDVPRAKAWSTASEKCRAVLPFQDPAVVVRAYMGFPHALYEVTEGIANLFSHKKTIAVMRPEVASGESSDEPPIEPIVESILIGFAEKGYTIKRLTKEESSDASARWASEILADLLFVIIPIDDPVTGRLSDFTALNESLKDKRVFKISVAHAPRFLSQTLERPAPFEVRILSTSDELAIVVAGERLRIGSMIAGHLPWKNELRVPELKPYDEEERSIFKSRVLSFESSLPEGFKPYFKKDTPRIFDRAVIYHEGLDGSALAETLSSLNSKPLSIQGADNDFDSVSPCRWKDQRFLDWLLARGEKEATVRGLLIIDAALITDELKDQLSRASDQLLKMQNSTDSGTTAS